MTFFCSTEPTTFLYNLRRQHTKTNLLTLKSLRKLILRLKILFSTANKIFYTYTEGSMKYIHVFLFIIYTNFYFIIRLLSFKNRKKHKTLIFTEPQLLSHFLIQLKLYLTFHLPCIIKYKISFCILFLYYKISIRPMEIIKP